MKSKKRQNNKERKNQQKKRIPLINEIIGITLIGFAMLLLLALIMPDITGRVGVILHDMFEQPFGLGAYIIPVLIVKLGWEQILRRERPEGIMLGTIRGIGGILLLIATATLCSLLYITHNIMVTGGRVGIWFGLWLVNNFHYGAYIIVLTCIALGFILFTQSSVLVPLRILKKIGDWGVGIIQVVGTYIFTGSRINTGEEETVRYQKQQRYKKGEEETEKYKEDVISVRIPEVVLPEDTSIPQDKTVSYTTSQPQQLPCEYQLPDITLLNDPPVTSEKDLREDLLMTSKLLSETLEDFGIDAKVVQVNRGPVVTSFEVQPAPGVKVSKIVSLSDDIALALAAPSIRIEAPIPGKKVIGIEIPNRKATTVGLKEVLLSQEFKNSTSKLTLGLGKDIMGNPVITDLAKMPHMLVAGATGSGKSVCINGAIMSILYKAHPDEVKFLMIDPKMVELSIYNGIPHLRFPVITGPKEAVKSLRWLVKEMEDRYKLLASEGVRHIDNYNNRMKTRNEKIMPYIVAVIDELADLMMVASQECEDAIARLAQMARAVGIHLILATQRPSVDVITGVIKANFPSRIAFQVFSKTDSRTILDMNGAEKLLGRGDMLFLPPSAPKPIRLQGSFLTNEEIERVLNFIKAQGFEPPDEKFSPCILEDDQTTPFEQDELFENALRLAVRMEGISTSMIQRKLKIGYNRAARLVELMEEHNFIGPADGVKPREVYITHEDLERLFGKK